MTVPLGKLQTFERPTDADAHRIGNETHQRFFVMTLTKRALPYLTLFEDAQFTTIPKNSGGFNDLLSAVTFRKIKSLWTPADNIGPPLALVEGEPPIPKDLSIEEVRAVMKQYGDWIKVSDLAEDASIDGAIVHAAEVLGEYEGQKLHRVMLYALDDGSSTWTGDTGVIADENLVTGTMVLDGDLLRRLQRAMKKKNAARFPDSMYHMIIDPDQTFDLQQDPDFLEAAKYAGGTMVGGGLNMLTGEVGRGWGFRIKEANELITGTGAVSAKTYHAVAYGPNGFGMLDLATQAVKKIDPRTNRGISVFTQPVNRPDKSDPLGQTGFVSCKVSFAGIVFDPVQVTTVITSASA